MGFSSSISILIIFSGLLVAAMLFLGTTRSGYEEIVDSYNDMIENDLEKLDTSLKVDHAYYNNSSNKMEFVMYSEGESIIGCDKLNIIVDGEVSTSDINFQMNWESITKIFPKKEGVLTIEINNTSIPYSSLPPSQRLGSIPFTPPSDTVWMAFWDGFYTLMDDDITIEISRYHLNGDLDWEVDVTAQFGTDRAVSLQVESEIYVCSDSNYVKAFDLDGVFLRTYLANEMEPIDVCVANDRLYVVEGDPAGMRIGAYVFDLATAAYISCIEEEITAPLAIDADLSGNIYVLDAGVLLFNETFSGAVDNNWIGDDDAEVAPSDEWWHVEQDGGDQDDIRVGNFNGPVSANDLDFIDCDDDWAGQWAEARYNGGDNWFDLRSYYEGNISFVNTGGGMDDANEGWRLEVTRNGGVDWVTVIEETAGDANHGWQSYSYELVGDDLLSDEFSFRVNSASSAANEFSTFDNVTFVVIGPGNIDIFDSNNNYVTTIANDLDDPVWFTIANYLENDRIFVLEDANDTAWAIKVYSFTGDLIDTIYVNEVYSTSPGGYCTIADGGALFLYSPSSRLVLEFRIGSRVWIVTENGIKTLVMV